MYGFFTFQFVGTCVEDAKFDTLRNGTNRATLNVAVNYGEKKEDGTYEERTTWVRVAFFGKRAEAKTLQWCRKGTAVAVEGTVQSYKKELPDMNLTMYNFKARTLRSLTSGSRPEATDEGAPMAGADQPRPAAAPVETPLPDDDLPDAFS